MSVLDLRGVSCPMNWVKTKLVLEEMEGGQILEVLLDDGEPIRNVPRSVSEEGHKLIKVMPEGSHFRLIIQRSSLFELPSRYAEEMMAHARAEAPNECCGLLAGKEGKIKRLYKAANAENSPVRYSLNPQELLKIINDIEAQDWELWGIYHSHTHSPAFPSATDIRLAFWPDSLYFIISLMDPEKAAIRAFHIVDGTVSEAELKVSHHD